MKPLRITDGYTEVAATDERSSIELYFANAEGQVTQTYLTKALAIHLAIWIFKWWISSRWTGIRGWYTDYKIRKSLNL